MCIVEIHDMDIILGLCTSCSRFPKKFAAICQRFAQMLLKKSQKLLFVTKVAQKTNKKRNFLLSYLFGCKKYANCTTKARFLSIFVQFCSVASIAK